MSEVWQSQCLSAGTQGLGGAVGTSTDGDPSDQLSASAAQEKAEADDAGDADDIIVLSTPQWEEASGPTLDAAAVDRGGSIFGELLLRPPPGRPAPDTAEKKKAQQFIYSQSASSRHQDPLPAEEEDGQESFVDALEDIEEFYFADVKYMQLQVGRFTICNGEVACQFEFINKPDEKAYSKKWLAANPSKGFLHPGAEKTVMLEVFVNKSTATHLNSGEEKLEDILVLHLQRGKDYFISVTGNYLPSCFGAPLHTLCHMREPIQDMSAESIQKLYSELRARIPFLSDDAIEAEKPMDIPKELWMMVDHLYRNASQQEYLFQQPGLKSEFEQIRDCLDKGIHDSLFGSNHSVAEALLLFLESLPEPVICSRFYRRCLESACSYRLSSQIISKLPRCHKNVFEYLMAFLQELLRKSGKNHLDTHILGSIFGELLLRPPPGRPAPDTAEKKKAQQFICQFLLRENDLLWISDAADLIFSYQIAGWLCPRELARGWVPDSQSASSRHQDPLPAEEEDGQESFVDALEDIEEFYFAEVKYMQLQVGRFTICNGEVACQFEFINKPDEKAYSKKWLAANPSKGFLHPELG
ncbi:type II inositol 1,4,5-trisphosphate 5-phosphatase-like [Heliangelus exortis]|uniref:type II inositol 1,4,5-trisphosphate 5-phosphatase-like n=1 Tax=Heliangelus exortis TaxID=472823 RepID=UPI003A92208D